MRPLIVLAMMTSSALLSAVPADSAAANPTCHGKPATIVGRPGTDLKGTPGDDVVVSNGADLSDTGAGDDLICVTGPVPFDFGVQVLAGAGSDTVDTTGVTGLTYITLNSYTVDAATDVDNVEGGYGRDFVNWAGPGSVDIHTGNGDDLASGVARPGDVIDLGDGNDEYEPRVDDPLPATLAPVDGGSGTNQLAILGNNGPTDSDWVVDDATGTATRDGATVARWAHFTDFSLTMAAHDVTFTGGAQAEHVTYGGYEGPPTGSFTASMGGGNDDVTVVPGEVHVDGGPGRDLVTVLGYIGTSYGPHMPAAFVHVNLGTGTIGFGSSVPAGTIAGAEAVDVRGRYQANYQGHAVATEVRLTGSAGNDHLRVFGGGCTVRIDGRGGDDVLTASERTRCDTGPPPAYATVLTGGAGDDTLLGGPGDDHLIGGPGTDTANGRGGVDTCSAERTTRCQH